MMQSSIYVKCPQCNAKGLLQELQGKYLCANCNFDYTALKDQPQKLDEVLLANLREGPWGQLSALELHRRVTLMPNQESIDYVKRLAESNGIKLPAGKKCFVATACYGDEFSQEVVTLRIYRDKYLKQNLFGRFFIIIYYIISPYFTKLLDKSENMKYFIKKLILKPLVKHLNRKLYNGKYLTKIGKMSAIQQQ